jgi:hypothetical protein
MLNQGCHFTVRQRISVYPNLTVSFCHEATRRRVSGYGRLAKRTSAPRCLHHQARIRLSEYSSNHWCYEDQRPIRLELGDLTNQRTPARVKMA